MTLAGRLAVLVLAVTTMSEPRFQGEATHATRGTVKRAEAAEIVVTRPKSRGDITIAVSPSTHVDGTIRVGATVSVRYHDDHGHHVATAIAVEQPRPRPH
jgi:hypothetical protein